MLSVADDFAPAATVTRAAGSKPGRAGVTLIEVLTSMMLMSIDVIAVAALFPIAVVRSLQATQLTNATNLRLNAEALIDTIPSPVHDLDGDGDFRNENDPGVVEHIWTQPPDQNLCVNSGCGSSPKL